MVLGSVVALVLLGELVAVALTVHARARTSVRHALVLGALTITAFAVGVVGCVVELVRSFGHVAVVEPVGKASTLAGDIDHAMAILVVGVIGATGPAIGTLLVLARRGRRR
jgi:hypothetical protein